MYSNCWNRYKKLFAYFRLIGCYYGCSESALPIGNLVSIYVVNTGKVVAFVPLFWCLLWHWQISNKKPYLKIKLWWTIGFYYAWLVNRWAISINWVLLFLKRMISMSYYLTNVPWWEERNKKNNKTWLDVRSSVCKIGNPIQNIYGAILKTKMWCALTSRGILNF